MKKIEYINAGAGSGKTYRLTHKLAALLLGNEESERIEPSQVIVTTFTKAAAAEVKERARQVLMEEGRVREAAQLDSAAIGTTHAVAQMLINRFWYMLGASPNQDVITDEDKRLYRNQSLALMLKEGRFAKQRQAIDTFYREFQPTKFEGTISVDNPEFWAEDLERLVGKITYYEIGAKGIEQSIEESNRLIDLYFNQEAPFTQEDYKSAVDALTQIALEYAKTGKPSDTKSNIHKTLSRTTRELTYDSLNSLYSFVADPRKAKGWQELVTDIAPRLGRALRSSSFGTIVKACAEALFELAQAWQEEYETFKRQHGVIDYDDMEKGLLKLLELPEVEAEIAQTYKLVMVDEFQDCNPVQLKIFDRLSEIIAPHSPLAQSSIWVGDPKQAIYGFRGSDTELINRVSDRFPAELRKPDPETFLLRDTLDTSYRSRENLVKLVNGLFHREELFPEMTELKADIKETESWGEALEMWNYDDSTNDMVYANLAKTIRERVEANDWMILPKKEKEFRPVGYGDIAILVRDNYAIDEIVTAIRKEGLPVSAPEKKIADRAEVQLMLALLTLSEKNSAHEWAAVKHLWCDVPTEELLADRLQFVKNKDGEEGPKWLADDPMLEPIRLALKHVRNLPIDGRIESLILELDLFDMVAKWGEVRNRKQNMQTLLKLAKQFVQRCERLNLRAGVHEFRQYLDEVEINPDKDTDKTTIKVYTYHRSKGLEWPVVILASLEKDELKIGDLVGRSYWGVHEWQDETTAQELLPTYHVTYFPKPSRYKEEIAGQPGAIDQNLLDNIRTRVRGEIARLLYVGITRARDYVVILSQNTPLAWPENLGLEQEDFHPLTHPFTAILPPKPRSNKSDDAAKEAYKEALAEWEERLGMLNPIKSYQLRDLDPLHELENKDKFLSPSKMTNGKKETVEGYELIQIRESEVEVRKKDAEDKPNFSPSVLGTCIHNIFAACPFDSKNGDEQQREQYLATAKTILDNYHLAEFVPHPEQLVDALQDLYAWLTDKYGPAIGGIVHEYPFNFVHEETQVVRGEIDLIWQAEAGDVIIDFKNYSDNINEVITPSSPHYVGKHYVPQLQAYRQILEKAGHTVIDTLLYYDLKGYVVKV